MKKIKNFDEFEQRLKNESSQICSDNKPQIIQSLTSPSTKKAKRLSVVAVMSICLILSVAAASAMEFSGLTFFKNDTSSLFEMETMTEEEMEPHHYSDEIFKKNRQLLDSLHAAIPEGKFIYFLDVEAYEQTGILDISILHYIPNIKNVDEILPYQFAQSLNLNNELLNEYHLKRGTILFKTPELSDEEWTRLVEKLQQQAKQLNRHYGVLEGDLLKEIHSISLWYQTNDFPFYKRFDVGISAIKNKLETSEDLSSFIELESDLGSEVYYSEEKRTLLFVQKDETGKYLVSIRNPVISEENVELQKFIDVAKSLLSKE